MHPKKPGKREELEEQYQVVFTAVCIRLILLACVLLSGAEATPDGLHPGTFGAARKWEAVLATGGGGRRGGRRGGSRGRHRRT